MAQRHKSDEEAERLAGRLLIVGGDPELTTTYQQLGADAGVLVQHITSGRLPEYRGRTPGVIVVLPGCESLLTEQARHLASVYSARRVEPLRAGPQTINAILQGLTPCLRSNDPVVWTAYHAEVKRPESWRRLAQDHRHDLGRTVEGAHCCGCGTYLQVEAAPSQAEAAAC